MVATLLFWTVGTIDWGRRKTTYIRHRKLCEPTVATASSSTGLLETILRTSTLCPFHQTTSSPSSCTSTELDLQLSTSVIFFLNVVTLLKVDHFWWGSKLFEKLPSLGIASSHPEKSRIGIKWSAFSFNASTALKRASASLSWLKRLSGSPFRDRVESLRLHHKMAQPQLALSTKHLRARSCTHVHEQLEARHSSPLLDH